MQRQFAQFPLVWAVIGCCFLVFGLRLLFGVANLEFLFMPGSGSQLGTQPWRIVTPILIHYTLLHLLINLYLWWLMARQIESTSVMELLSVLVLGAVVGNFVEWYVLGPHFGGLSGVVYAVCGYLMVARWRKARDYELDPVLAGLLVLMLPVAASGALGKFAIYAHIAGLAVGALWACLLPSNRPLDSSAK